MNQIEIVQDMDQGIAVMHRVGTWMKNQGLNYSQWWNPKNMNRRFLLQYSEPNEYYVAMTDNQPIASVILQQTERNQSWQSVDGHHPQKALYVHWLCVDRHYAGLGLSKKMIEFAQKLAKAKGYKLLRLDTDADEPKLCHLYRQLGFQVKGIEKEEERNVIYFEKIIP